MTQHRKTPASIRTRLAAAALGAGSLIALAPAAFAAEDNDAAKLVTTTADEAVSALEDGTISDAEANEIMSDVDIDGVAKFTLGNKWADISADERARYVDAFEIFARNQLKQHLSGLSGATVEVTDVIPRGDTDSIVVTQVSTSGEDRPTEMSWRVVENGSWHIVDIQAQDIWFAIEQRAQFQAILDRNNGDIDALIAEITS